MGQSAEGGDRFPWSMREFGPRDWDTVLLEEFLCLILEELHALIGLLRGDKDSEKWNRSPLGTDAICITFWGSEKPGAMTAPSQSVSRIRCG